MDAFRTLRLRACSLPVVFAVLAMTLSVRAAWYWPFDPDSTNKPPRLHRLLEKANDYIELAENDALTGEGDKAIENYRLALKELDRVEDENPDRAETPEFAPLRNKRATCSAAIDAIRFAQISENARAVSLTNTRDLEKKWRRKHGLLTPEDIEEDRRKAEKEKAEKEAAEKAKAEKEKAEKEAAEKAKAEKEKAEREAAEKARAEKEAAEKAKAERARKGRKPEKKAQTKNPDEKPAADAAKTATMTFEERRKAALFELRKQDYATADMLLAGLLEERPDDLSTLQLQAAAQMGLGRGFAARRTLEKAMRAHPKSYLPCYNLALLSLKLGEPVAEARAYYEKGRELGGPRNEMIEEKLK